MRFQWQKDRGTWVVTLGQTEIQFEQAIVHGRPISDDTIEGVAITTHGVAPEAVDNLTPAQKRDVGLGGNMRRIMLPSGHQRGPDYVVRLMPGGVVELP